MMIDGKDKKNCGSKRKFKGSPVRGFAKNFIAVDVETTAGRGEYNRIIEIGAVSYVNGEAVDSFDSLINVGFPISRFVENLTGITNDELRAAEGEYSVLERFLGFVDKFGNAGEKAKFLAHNANFDINMIYDAVLRDFGRYFSYDYIDTLAVSRRVLPCLPHHKLMDLAEYFKLDYSGAHRASFDARLAAECYLKMQSLE